MDNRENDKMDLEELDQIAAGFKDEDLTPEELEELNRFRTEGARLEAERKELLAKGYMPNPFEMKDFNRAYCAFCRQLRQKYGNS